MLTLIIHGTFARDETWWRLDPRAGFAGRLEDALSRRGMPGTVWQPALDAGLDYGAFCWNHNNYHPDRRHGARDLARALNQLARDTNATREQPLAVNFVAHSHGGNVVLAALPYLNPNVRARRVVLLGTPLISARPALRILRLLIAAVLLACVGLAVLMPVVFLAAPPEGMSGLGMGALAVGAIVLYGWMLLGAVTLVDRFLQVVTWPLSWLRGRGAGQVYGPTPAELARRIDSGRITLFTTHDDEADLALQLGATPRRLYAELVKVKLHPIARVLEMIFVRPVVFGVVLGVLETVLERYVLGFPWLNVLFFNYEMADLKTTRAYPPSVLERIDVSEHVLPSLRRSGAMLAIAAMEPAPVVVPKRVRQSGRQVRTLYEKLARVAENFKAQLRLRHSVYYEVDAVTERVADVLVDPVTEIRPPTVSGQHSAEPATA